MSEYDVSPSGQEPSPRPDLWPTDLSQDKDAVMETILDNIHNTPLGLVLKRIASLPEVRQEKVLHVRREITLGRYDLAKRLDQALEKVLHDLTT